MAMRIGDRAGRVLRFLLALSDSAIATILEERGMTQDDVDEGWALLQALGRRRLSGGVSPKEISLREQLDEWENYYYPIIEAVLARHFPVVRDNVFANLSQVDADEVAFSVSILMERLDGLKDPANPLGEDGPKALAFLEKRKVDESVLSQARALLAELRTFAPIEGASPAEIALELEEAENRVWAWYLEWSRIARVAVKSRRLLRKLGYLDSRWHAANPDEGLDDDDAGDETPEDVAPQDMGAVPASPEP